VVQIQVVLLMQVLRLVLQREILVQ